MMNHHHSHTLRTKLIASHVAVILIALLLLLIIGGMYARRQENRFHNQRVDDAISSIALVSAHGTESVPFGPGRLAALDAIAGRLGLHLVVYTESGLVVHDTHPQDNLTGEPVPFSDDQFTTVEFGALSAGGNNSDATRTISAEAASDSAGSVSGGGEPLYLGIADPESNRPFFPRLTMRLVAAAILALIVASAAGYWLSNRISRPIADLTIAANDMTEGNLRQDVDGSGSDEIGRLVSSFNAMSSRIADVDAAQRRLLADVAHELRTPLTSIQGYARALDDDIAQTSEERHEALSTVRSEADRMARLLAQMLDLARAEAVPVQMQRVDLAQLVSEAEVRFAPDARTRSISLKAHSRPNSIVRADPDRIIQVIDNLLSNALRHTPAGGEVIVEAYHAASTDGGGFVILAVDDSGAGIDQETLPRLFDRFQRGPNGSSGLGMAIVRDIAQLHNATIDVQNRPDAGTRIELRFRPFDASL